MDVNEQLKGTYYDPTNPGAFGGARKLKKGNRNLKTKNIREWLSGQDTYTLHKSIKRKFKRRRIIVSGIDAQWQADLIDLSSLKKHNDGYTFALTVIDVFSKFAWVVPIKNKGAESVLNAFKEILQKSTREPNFLHTDLGKEFVNSKFQRFLKEKGIEYFNTQNNEIKAAVVERLNRTIKERLWRYFTFKNTLRYTDILQDLLDSYNHSFHSSIEEKPVNVTVENQEKIWQTLYGDPEPIKEHTDLKNGDFVRISKTRQTFKKGYLPNWTTELFIVARVEDTNPTTYTIKDQNGDVIEGRFYREEIQKVQGKDIFNIEKILRSRLRGRKREFLIKWDGYPDSFNSWVPEKDIVKNG